MTNTRRCRCQICKKVTTTSDFTECGCKTFGICPKCAATMTEAERFSFLSECRCEASHKKSCDMSF